MAQFAFCAWCGHSQQLFDGIIGFCPKCSHRLGVPKELCDCLMCFVPATEEQLSRVTLLPIPDGSTLDVELPDVPAINEALYDLPDLAEAPTPFDVHNLPSLDTSSRFAEDRRGTLDGCFARIPFAKDGEIYLTVQLDMLCVSVWNRFSNDFASEAFITFTHLLKIMPAVLASMTHEQRGQVFMMLQETE